MSQLIINTNEMTVILKHSSDKIQIKSSISTISRILKFIQLYPIVKNYPWNEIIEKMKLKFQGCKQISNFKNLTDLIFDDNFNEKLNPNVFPDTITHLTFGKNFNQPIEPNVLPKFLKSLTFGENFNQEMAPNVLPKFLKSLTFGENFNQEIGRNILPKSLTHLTFGDEFNQVIFRNILPKNLTHLTFGYKFRQFLMGKNILPDSITHLTFGQKYTLLIPAEDLPRSLIYLTNLYNISLSPHDSPENQIPKSLYYVNIKNGETISCRNFTHPYIFDIIGFINERTNKKHLYYSLKFKKQFRALLWEKIRLPKVNNKCCPKEIERLINQFGIDKFEDQIQDLF